MISFLFSTVTFNTLLKSTAFISKRSFRHIKHTKSDHTALEISASILLDGWDRSCFIRRMSFTFVVVLL